jgi:hypothetical protein
MQWVVDKIGERAGLTKFLRAHGVILQCQRQLNSDILLSIPLSQIKSLGA